MLRKWVRGIVAVLAAAALVTGGVFAYLEVSSRTVRLDLEDASPFGTFDGFGTSLAWWGYASEDWPEEMTDEIVDLLFDEEDGLGFKIARYNIGAGDNPDHDHMGPYRQMETFQPEEGVWDWEADAGQRNVLLKAIDKGVNRTEAFANSAPYWMTVSGCTGGAGEHGDTITNLQEDYYDAFADYLTEVVLYYRDSYGVEFDTLSPINEPNNAYWYEGNWQEGAYYDNGDVMDRIIQGVTTSLTEKPLSTQLSFDDENRPSKTVENYESLSSESQNSLTILNTHAYKGKMSERRKLRDLAEQENLTLYMSEVDASFVDEHDHNSLEAALGLGQLISDDLNGLQPKGWVFWQAVECEEHMEDAGNWGLIHANFEGETDEKEYAVTKKYYAMAQYSKYIKQGYTLVESSNSDVACAYNAEDGTVVVVAVNAGKRAKNLTVDLSKIAEQAQLDFQGAQVQAVITDETRDLAELDGFTSTSDSLKLELSGQSITTYVITPKQ
ncbi:MAG: hypothetical protein LIO46_05450 [Clostridiales bacterium]|nr:hypothetical protein [Clostridiales bacterium]